MISFCKCWRNKKKQSINVTAVVEENDKIYNVEHEVSTIKSRDNLKFKKSSLKQTKGDVKNWQYHLTNEHL